MYPQGGGQFHHDGEGNLYFFYPQGILHRPGETLHIGHGVIQSGLTHGDHQRAEGVFKGNAALAQLGLAFFKNRHFLGTAQVGGLHAALIGRGDVGDEHGAVGEHLAVAGKAPAGIKFFLRNVAAGDGFHLAVQQLYPALAAGAVAGAGGINSHIGPAGQLQQVVAHLGFDDHGGGAAFDLECNSGHKNTSLYSHLASV